MLFSTTPRDGHAKKAGTATLRRSRAACYIFAVVGPFLIGGVQLAFSLMEAPLFSMYFWALLLTRFWGLGPGVVTSLTSTIVGNYFFLTPMGEFSWYGQSAYFTALFALMSTTSVAMLASVQKYALTQRQLLSHEQKISQQNETLAQALQKAVSARDDFLAVAGHELKTPVTALSLQAQSWGRRLSRGDKMTADAAIEAWGRQAKGLERLGNLIDELLDVSGLNRGQLSLNLETLDLCEVVHDVIVRYTDVAADSKCRVTVNAAHPVWGDYDRMRIEQVLGNLLTNALKYGAGSPVEIHLRQKGSEAVLQVRDYGRGITTMDQKRIFERFERIQPDLGTSGLGLGLWIVRQIVTASGGRIEVQSTLGQGSEFTVYLPVAPPAIHSASQ